MSLIRRFYLEVAKTTLGYKKGQRWKPWIQNWIFDLTVTVFTVEKEDKTKDLELHTSAQGFEKEVRRKVTEDKQEQIDGLLQKLEEENQNEMTRQVLQTIKTLTRKFWPQ